MLWAWWVGCASEDSVNLWGIVWDGPGETAPSLPGVEVSVVDELGRPLASAEAGPDGAFEVVVPGGDAVFVEIRGEGLVTTTFPGVVGLQAEQRIEDHTLYALRQEVADGLFAAFEGCPGADGRSAAVYGEVRIDGLADAVTGGSPTVGTGRARVLGNLDGSERDACYYDWSGTRYEPKWDLTGPSGRFAVFDVQPGVQVIELEYEVAPDVRMTQAYPVWIPEDPVVLSPWFPFLVAFPF